MINQKMQSLQIFITDEADADEMIKFLKENDVTWFSGRKVDAPSSTGISIRSCLGSDTSAIIFVTPSKIMWADKNGVAVPWKEFKQRFNINVEPIRLSDYIL